MVELLKFTSSFLARVKKTTIPNNSSASCSLSTADTRLVGRLFIKQFKNLFFASPRLQFGILIGDREKCLLLFFGTRGERVGAASLGDDTAKVVATFDVCAKVFVFGLTFFTNDTVIHDRSESLYDNFANKESERLPLDGR